MLAESLTEEDRLPEQVRVVIEVPRGSFIKWDSEGGIDFISPLPCPFNYGSAPDHRGDDGDPADVVVLGSRRSRHATDMLPVVGRVRFIDQGVRDDKWICTDRAVRRRHRLALTSFFWLYAMPKRALGLLTRKGPSRYEGLQLRQQD